MCDLLRVIHRVGPGRMMQNPWQNLLIWVARGPARPGGACASLRHLTQMRASPPIFLNLSVDFSSS
jgi:hypothetical protein